MSNILYDISTSHDDFNYHLKVIYKIFEATQKAGFKLTREKTQFAVSEITLFGRIISQDGVRPDPERIAAIERYLTLKSIHEVRSFLGFANQFLLTDDQQRTFESLKTAITTAPILAYFKQGLPTFVETDASYSGLGAVLSQEQNGKRRVIEYASRTLKDAETRYHSNELECTAQISDSIHTLGIVSADHIICLPETRNGKTNMLVQIDHATRYVIATPSASLAAHTVTDALYHNIILRYGPPKYYLSDGGEKHLPHVTLSGFFKNMESYNQRTPPYSPQAKVSLNKPKASLCPL
ncbi:Retrovirus-related Pol polyprotein like [Argiope bruennichi]|uniref:Retrovirus-related Pol polyprotein like n=1 Tax=Argiope bruennichi TaxID=94029 RepID=A0A8T0EZA5_ARGBR|nr:Retrovirus-related Pol polyprotein like [Argiope bruennichi]